MKKTHLFILVGLVVVMVFIFLTLNAQNIFFPKQIPLTETTVTQPITDQQVVQASPDNSTLKAGGSSYCDSQGVFSFLYPNDYALDHQDGDKYTRISKRGATQKGQTEMYDGVIVSFERISLEEKTLSDWVDDQIQQATTDGTSELTSPKQEVDVYGYSGFSYELRGLGTSTYLVFQKDTNSHYAISITSLVADPQQKGYQQEVDAILSTVELRK